MEEKVEVKKRPLDSTEITEIILDLQAWINQQQILGSKLYVDYSEGTGGLGFCIKTDCSWIIEEDVLGNFLAEVSFYIYYKTSATPDGSGIIYKPLNDLSKWIAENDFTNLEMGVKRTPKEIMTLKGPVDVKGRDENGNTTLYSTYKFQYYEEAK